MTSQIYYKLRKYLKLYLEIIFFYLMVQNINAFFTRLSCKKGVYTEGVLMS
jgi:hypothetical protein